jgi:hypothetical protein
MSEYEVTLTVRTNSDNVADIKTAIERALILYTSTIVGVVAIEIERKS